MSFRTAITDVELCNRALALLPEEPIPSMDAGGLAARTARRWYKPTVAWLLTKYHWNLATRRATLATVANTRSDQWNFAYALPADTAFIRGIASADTSEGAALGYYSALRNLFQQGQFLRVGQTLYSAIDAAVLDYTSLDVEENEFDEEFANVIVLWLASRFAMPITKKPALQQKYEQSASDAMTLAMARDSNENQATYGNTPSESELVRGDAFNLDYYPLKWPRV